MASKNQSFEESCEVSEAIQNLPPELREIISKEYIAIKIKEKKEMGWGKVHENLKKLPFCEFKQQIARLIICFDYPDCPLEGKCSRCFDDEGNVREMRRSEFNGFKIPCSLCDYHYHESFLADNIKFLEKSIIRLSHCGDGAARGYN